LLRTAVRPGPRPPSPGPWRGGAGPGWARLYLAVGAALFLALAAWFVALIDDVIVDDAYITLIYARSLAEGHGLVYTDGLRVEGYTDFLWVLLGAAAFSLDLDPILVFRAVSIAAVLALLLAVQAWSERLSIAPPRWRIGVLLLGASGPLAYWAIGGLETSAFAALAFIATLWATTGGRWAAPAGLLFFLAFLAHPDALLLAAPAGAYLALRCRDGRSPREAVAFALALGLPLAAYWCARWAYFGDLMPNTFYAKSTFTPFQALQGVTYLFLYAPVAGFFAAFLIAVAARRALWQRPAHALLLAQLGAWLAYVVYVGGDFMVLFRFVVPLTPALALLLQESVWAVASTSRSRHFALAAGSAVALATSLFWLTAGEVQDRLSTRVYIQRGLNELGAWFAGNTAPETTIAVSAAGAVPYFSGRPAVDMLGLNDPHIARDGRLDPRRRPAHKKYDAAYVLERAPAFIVLNLIEELGQPLEGEQYSRHGKLLGRLVSNDALFEDERFWSEYTRIIIPDLETYPVVMARKDVAQTLVSRGLAYPSPVSARARD
jgi:hypothetical protein